MITDFVNLLSPAQGCPWSGFSPDTLHFCEERLCAWVVSPAEAWTNILYLVIGIVLLKKFRAFGLSAIAVGICSFIYHASHVHWTETLDLASMNFLGALLITLNIKRLKPELSRLATAIAYATVLFLSWASLLIFDGTDRLAVFGVLLTVTVILEAMIKMRSGNYQYSVNYRWFWAAFGILGVSFFIWQLDFHKISCDPGNHLISGHGIWHLMNSFCFYCLARFYRHAALSGAPMASANRERPH